jgi:hypothetical protein
MPMLSLIQRDDCALCDLAWDILQQAGVRDFAAVYIDGDADAEIRYGARVPVLRLGDAELAWPFDAETVRAWLATTERG